MFFIEDALIDNVVSAYVLNEIFSRYDCEAVWRLVTPLQYAFGRAHAGFIHFNLKYIFYHLTMHGFKERPPVHNQLLLHIYTATRSVLCLILLRKELLLRHILLLAYSH